MDKAIQELRASLQKMTKKELIELAINLYSFSKVQEEVINLFDKALSEEETEKRFKALAKELVPIITKTYRSASAKKAAIASVEKRPASKAKKSVKECWEKWQANKKLYRNKAHFSQSMCKKYPELTSQRVIENWTRDWEKEKQ